MNSETVAKTNLYVTVSTSEIMKQIETDIQMLIKESDRLNACLKKEREQAKADIRRMLINFIEVLDAFDRVFKNIQEKELEIDKQTRIWMGNFGSIRNLVERKLRESGISVIEAPEGKAIPGLHTIVETKIVEGLSDDTILEEIEKGYISIDSVIRKSSVITVKNNEDKK